MQTIEKTTEIFKGLGRHLGLSQQPLRVASSSEGKEVIQIIDNEILRPNEKNLRIRALSGRQRLLKANPTLYVITEDFLDAGLTRHGVATPETRVDRYHVAALSTSYLSLFESLSGSWNDMWLSQHQIFEFCRQYRDLLISHDTAFLIKIDEHAPVDEEHPERNLLVFNITSQDERELYGWIHELDHGRSVGGRHWFKAVVPHNVR